MSSRADNAVCVGRRSLCSDQGRLSTVVGGNQTVVGRTSCVAGTAENPFVPTEPRFGIEGACLRGAKDVRHTTDVVRRTTYDALGSADDRGPTTDDRVRPTTNDVLNSELLSTPLQARLAVLAAHPDDETIGASVLLARATDPIVIYLTDGAPRDRRLWPPDFKGSRDDYANLRRKEALNALSLAGVTESHVTWLGATDQEAIFSASELANRLREVLKNCGIQVLITHPYEGGHPDHDTAALVAQLSVSQLPRSEAPLVFEMTSYHLRKGQCVTGEFLNSSFADEIVFELSDDDRRRKQNMFDAHASQRLVLQSFATTQERFRRGPEYEFSKPPHEGRLWYECMGWPMTGERWRELATPAMTRLQECACR